MENKPVDNGMIELVTDINIFMGSLELVLKKRKLGKTYFAKIDWVESDEAKPIDNPNSDWNKDFVISLQDEAKEHFIKTLLYELKLRGILDKSAKVEGLEAELKAKKEHLDDMRVMVAHERDYNFKGLQ